MSPSLSLVADNIQDNLKFKLHKTFLENISTVSIRELKESNFEIYPNPTNGIIVIDNKISKTNYSVDVFNILGEKVFSIKEIRKGIQIDLLKNGFSSGTYFIKLSTKDINYYSKIVFR